MPVCLEKQHKFKQGKKERRWEAARLNITMKSVTDDVMGYTA